MTQTNTVTKFERKIKRETTAIPGRTIQVIKSPTAANPPHAPSAPPGSGLFGMITSAASAASALWSSPQAASAPTPFTSHGSGRLSIAFYGLNKARVDACERYVRQMLDASRVTSGEKRLLSSDLTVANILGELQNLAAEKGAEVTVATDGRSYTLSTLGEDRLRSAERYVEDNSFRCEREFIRRRDSAPKDWVPQPTYNVDPVNPGSNRLFDVPSGSVEWRSVEDRFNKGGFGASISRIQRVQHPDLWKRYAAERALIARENGGDPNELCDLKHGTGQTNPGVLVDSDCGVDQRYVAGRCMYGYGSYFAEDTKYSDNGYVYNTAGGKKQMFLCRVTAGKVDQRLQSTAVEQSLKHPKAGHHSVRGPVRGQMQAYIVYQLYRAYPEYLIEYTK